MRVLRSIVVVCCLVLLTAGSSLAQQVRQAPAPERGYMTGSMGASFGDSTAATFGVEYGEAINRRVQAYAAFQYFDDLLIDAARDDLALLGSQLTAATGVPWSFTGRDRGLSFSGGAKYVLAESSNTRPYIGGGPGVLNIQRSITERDLGEVSDAVISVFGAPDGVIDPTRMSTFKPMVEFIAGVGFSSGRRTYVDVGYRFRKVFRSRERFDFSQFTVGVGMRF
jgi:opacity protein-like surface antigen